MILAFDKELPLQKLNCGVDDHQLLERDKINLLAPFTRAVIGVQVRKEHLTLAKMNSQHSQRVRKEQ